MSRNCSNWLHAYLDWTLPRSEAPETYILWTGLLTVASVLKRNVCFPKRMMGSYTIYPNLYVILIGPAGGPRKSTTMKYAYELVEDLKLPNLNNIVNIASTSISASKLVETLSENYKDNKDGSITILSSEFASFVNISKDEMFDLLTDLYDGNVKHDYATRMHGLEVVKDPCVNLIAATTPSWIATASDHLSGGGFASRVIFVFENRVRQRKLYYDDVDWKKIGGLEKALMRDLQHISSLKGEFTHDSRETRDLMEEWYRSTADAAQGSEQIQGYFQRKHVHIHKVAMLLSIMEDDKLVITMEHFNQAKALLDAIEKNMPRALSSVGNNPYAHDIEKIEDYIVSFNGTPVERSRILRRFYHSIDPSKCSELLGALQGMGTIQLVTSGANPTYKAVRDEGL